MQLETELQKEKQRADEAVYELNKIQKLNKEEKLKEVQADDNEKKHKKNLIETLTENETLRNQVSELEDAISTLSQNIDEKNVVLEEKEKQIEQVLREKREVENEVEVQKSLLREKESEILTINDELNAVDELKAEIQETITSKILKWKEIIHNLQSQLDAEREKTKSTENTNEELLEELKNNDGLGKTEETAQAALEDIANTRNLLADSKRELSIVRNENVTLKTEQKKIIDIAIRKEQEEIQRLNVLLDEKNSELEEDKLRYKELYEEKCNLEKRIHDFELTLTEYESGYGLTEAVIKEKQPKIGVSQVLSHLCSRRFHEIEIPRLVCKNHIQAIRRQD